MPDLVYQWGVSEDDFDATEYESAEEAVRNQPVTEFSKYHKGNPLYIKVSEKITTEDIEIDVNVVITALSKALEYEYGVYLGKGMCKYSYNTLKKSITKCIQEWLSNNHILKDATLRKIINIVKVEKNDISVGS